MPYQKSSFYCSYYERAKSHHRNELDDGTIKKNVFKIHRSAMSAAQVRRTLKCMLKEPSIEW